MKIVSIVGARPQFIKAASISRVIRAIPGIHEVLLHTGQHYDRNMSEVFFSELDIPEPAFNLGVGSGSHANQTGEMMKGIEEILSTERPDWTLIFGDTNSTLAGALASVKLHIPVAHVEAGLRSFNRNMPEEINRIVADRVSDILFAPTPAAVSNLTNEGLGGITFQTGDVMYDSVLHYQKMILDSACKYVLKNIPSQYLLATIHRAENTDDSDNFRAILTALENARLPVVLPVHPRARKILAEMSSPPANITIIDPVGYLEMLRLTMGAFKVITDSGGLQKEAYFLNKPCITVRNETEWIETLHDRWNILAGTQPEKILEAIIAPLPDKPVRNDFGDGSAAVKIIRKLSEKV